MIMTIYLDLDETLVHAIPLRGGSVGRRKIVRCSDGDGYGVIERPLARKMISDCRSLAPTIVLTTGVQDYAEKVCEAFALEVDGVLGAEKFIKETTGEQDAPLETGVCPESWLIDNAKPDYFYARLKMAYLGAPQDRYLQVRTFTGKDPDQFAGEWEKLFAALRRAG